MFNWKVVYNINQNIIREVKDSRLRGWWSSKRWRDCLRSVICLFPLFVLTKQSQIRGHSQHKWLHSFHSTTNVCAVWKSKLQSLAQIWSGQPNVFWSNCVRKHLKSAIWGHLKRYMWTPLRMTRVRRGLISDGRKNWCEFESSSLLNSFGVC